MNLTVDFMLRTFIHSLGLVSLVILILALWHRHDLPPPAELDSALFNEPQQIQIEQAAFQTTRNEVIYTVQPLYDYELFGLVVSKHDANAWWDYVHEEWSDNLNIVDLCVIWGKNAQTGGYTSSDIAFSSAQFTCYWQTRTQEATAAFDTYSLSNNHLLSDDPQLAKVMRDAQIGDQIHFHGQLAEYSHNHGIPFKRGTSITRSDTGGHACETIFVDRFEILKPGNQGWRKLQKLAIAGLVLYLILWFKMPVRRYY